MGFWTKSVLIFKSLCENANQSIRQLARQTGMSKRSVLHVMLFAENLM